MMSHQEKNKGTTIEGLWNDLGTLERLKMILNYSDHFLNVGLITRRELSLVMACSESDLEYWLNRDPEIFFQNIDVEACVKTQLLITQMKTALKAVFLESEK